MAQTPQLSNIDAKDPAVAIALLAQQMTHLAEKLEQMDSRLDHMATKEQVAQLVARSEFDRLSWRVSEHEKDFIRLAKTVEDNKPMSLWKSFTFVVSGVTAVLVLVATVTGWKPH
jgi:hypothetical protein